MRLTQILYTVAVFSSLGLLGLLFPAVGSSLPSIETFFGINLSSSGFVPTYVQLGYSLFCFLGGIISDAFSKRNVLIVGCLIYALSGLFLGISQNWLLTLGLFFLFGIGSGLIFISSNTLVIDIFTNRSGTFLNIHHTFFAFGSLIAPFIVTGFISSGYEWFFTFRLLGVIALVIVAIIILSDMVFAGKREHKVYTQEEQKEPMLKKYMRVLKNKQFMKFLTITLLGVGVQFGIIYLLVSYLVKVRLTNPKTAGLVASGFFLGILVGRLICSYLVSRISAYYIVLSLLIVLTLTLVFGWLFEGKISLVMFALTGLGCSGLMPTLMALASSVIDKNVRAASLGFQAMAGGLGGMTVTAVISVLSELIGLDYSFLFLIIVSVVVTLLFASMTRSHYVKTRSA